MLDLGEERAQRLAVGGVAGQDLIGERQALRGDDERDDKLRTIGPLVAAVAVASFAVLRQIRGVDLEIRAGQIIKQHIEGGVEQIAPTFSQVRKQLLFVSQQQVVTVVELVRFRQAEVGPQEVGHGAIEEPLAMQPPLASRSNQPVGDEDLQHMVPARSLATSGQALGPETIELKLAPQDAGQPAGAKLARPAEPHLGEPQPDHVVAFGRLATILGEQRERPRPSGVLVEDLDRSSPRLGLARVDLAEVEHVALDHAPIIETPVLGDAPIKMRLSVLSPFGLSQEHGERIVPRLSDSGNPWRA